MNCLHCGFGNPPGVSSCTKCNTPLDLTGATVSGAQSGPAPGTGVVSVLASSAGLQPGSVLADRYEILQLLGEGGMGAVYKARDRELDRLVALKVIRPEMAGQPEILQRFKQELILARKVTHKNVNRIFDLGEANGTKFITMEYVDGQDLKTLLRQRGKLAPKETVEIIAQVCRALDAAHSEGVVHRDLKPHNIMVDKQGKVLVMDFGLAHSMDLTGFTQTGALLGTPEYMSPEQAKGEKVDPRSDLFALGIIFYEALTGETPFKADTPFATLLKRTQEQSPPPSKLVPSIPRYINDVVVKCLQTDPGLRYQSALEILEDLEVQRQPRTASMIARLPPRLRIVAHSRKWMVAGVAVLFVAIAGLLALRTSLFGPTETQPSVAPISLAILPFSNASGDQSLDWLGSGLADMLATDVGHSAHLRTVSSDRLHQILQDLRISPASILDSATLGRVAEFSSAEVLVWGKYLRFGEQIRIDATLQDLKRQRTISLKAVAPSEEELLKAVGQLAKAIHENLALSSDVLQELQAQSFHPSTESVEALRYYNEGLELSRQGNHIGAAEKFEAAVEADREFALAYAKLGQTYATLGYGNEAEQFSRQAADLSQDLPPQERYLILAHHARIVNDLDKAIESYRRLAQATPSNLQIQFELAGLYEAKGSFELAKEHYVRVLEGDPKHLDALYAAGHAEIMSDNYQASLDYLNRALSLAIQFDNQESKARILHAIGAAYKLLNKPQEALRYFEESLAIRQEIGDKSGMARSLRQLAQIHEISGQLDAAEANLRDALEIQREIGDRKGVGETLMDFAIFLQGVGQYDEALKLSKEALQVHLERGDEYNQALCRNNIGGIYFLKGQYNDALTYYQQALQLRENSNVPMEVWETRYNLAEVHSRLGQYDQSLSHYLRSLEISRESGDKYAEAVTSYGMGILFEEQGRYGAALSAMEEALRTFQELQDRSLWLGQILAGYGNALSLVGRNDEAQKALDEASTLARELQNDALIARVLSFQGDDFFYRGDFRTARPYYQKAQKRAAGTSDPHLILLAKINLAKLVVKEGHLQRATKALERLVQEADARRLKYLALEASIYLAEARVNSQDYSRAQRELKSALRKSEDAGLRALLVKSHYLLATALRLSGKSEEARQHYSDALQIAREIRQEAGSEKLMNRTDLNVIVTESTHWSAAPPA